MTVLTTTQFVADFVDGLVNQGVVVTDAAALKSTLVVKFTDWLGGGDAVPASLAQKLATAVGQFQAEILERYDFWTGTTTGGPNGDGTFPLTLPDGTPVRVPCLAKLTQSLQKGDPGGIGFKFSTATADADPGTGFVRLNNATLSSVTTLFVDDLELGGGSIAAWLNTFDDGTATGVTGAFLIQEVGSVHFALFQVTGPVIDGGGYRKIPVAHLASAGPFANNARLVASFSPPGAQGEKGWAPVLAAVNDGSRRVLQVTDWVGGQGTKPAVGSYVGPTSLVALIADALDVRGPQGPKLFEAVYATQAGLVADLAYSAGAFGLVYADGTASLNGTYVKSGAPGVGAWLQNGNVPGFSFQPLPPETGFVSAFVDASGRAAWMVALDGTFVPAKIALPAASVGPTALAPGAVDMTKLSPAVAASFANIPQTMPPEVDYAYAIVGALGRMVLGVLKDGSVQIPKLVLNPGAVTLANLGSEVTPLLAQPLNADSGYAWAIVDAAGRVALGVTPQGRVVISSTAELFAPGSLAGSALAASSLPASALDPAAIRQIVPQLGDVVEDRPDPWRYGFGSVGVQTEIEGTLWATLPPVKTTTLRGVNGSGTSLQFRRTSGLDVRGRRVGAAWNPVAVAAVSSTKYIADTTNPAGLSTAGRAGGDYYRYSGLTTVTFNSQTVGLGDLIVYDGSAYQVQKSPAPIGSSVATTRQPGDWWTVSTAGAFDGQVYAVGDRIVHVGFDSKSGFGNALWYKGQAVAKGELFYNGEFNPASGLPASPAQGDLWQASATGTAGGFTFAVGDYALYDGGAWGQIPTDPIVAVASGAMIPALRCVATAAEWEVRRTDKSATRVAAMASCRHQASVRRSMDAIICRSDSMFGVSGMQTNLGALVAPRSVTAIARGGGTSRNVLSTKEYEVAVSGDPHRGKFEFLWHGQNNQPGAVGDANWGQITESGLKLVELIGARDRRFCFLSILGQNNMSWNGSRIVVSQHEDQFNKTGALYAYEQWLASMFAGQWLSPRQILLAAAGSTPDLRAPGMTEAQTAATYGWVPLSFWNHLTAFTWSAAGLNYLGDWTTGALPTGGSANDYYRRISGTPTGAIGGVGNVLVNVGGVWQEDAFDITHIGPNAGQGGQALAAGLAAYLTSNKL